MKKVVVISLGGSLIVPQDIDVSYLHKLKKTLIKNTLKHKFVLVCGGGSIARKYINALSQEKTSKKELFQCLMGIAVTRLNARLITYIFGKEANSGIPHNMRQVKNLLKLNDIVFCGSLRYANEETSDSNAAKLAHFFKSDFINLTNVDGLYTQDPKKYQDAKLIKKITYQYFLALSSKVQYKPGQHFVLDQRAAEIIKNYKVKTFILGKNLKNLDNLLNGKEFNGTTIG